MNQSIVICDSEWSYAFHLQEYLYASSRIPCPVCIYTETAILLREQRPEETLLLVIAESEFDPVVCEQGFHPVLILNESSRMLSAGWPDVSKYQSMDHILAAILANADPERLGSTPAIRHAGDLQLIGFYTPLTHCLQTTFALTFGEVLGEEHKVLYLNFENWPAVSCALQSQPEGSVQELLYLNEGAKEKVAARLRQLVVREANLDLLPPLQNFVQLQAVPREAWTDLLETIREVSEYEYLLLDLSESVQGLLELLGQCRRIYTMTREGRAAEVQLEAYRSLLRSQEAQLVAAATEYTALPLFAELPVRIADYAQSPLTPYVRECVRRLHSGAAGNEGQSNGQEPERQGNYVSDQAAFYGGGRIRAYA